MCKRFLSFSYRPYEGGLSITISGGGRFGLNPSALIWLTKESRRVISCALRAAFDGVSDSDEVTSCAGKRTGKITPSKKAVKYLAAQDRNLIVSPMRFTGANDSTRSKVVAKYPGDPDYNLKPCQPAPVVSLSRFALPCYSPWFRRLDARLQRPGVAYCATLRGARRGQFCLTLRLVSFRADWKPIVERKNV